MLIRKITTCLFATVVLLGSGLFLTAQDTDPNPLSVEKRQLALVQQNNGSQFGGRWRYADTKQNRPANQAAVAVQAFKAAESDEAKSTAKSNLRKALVAEYENKMDQYDAHLEKLEKELEAMRERLARRRAAKEDMVDLKLKETIANADGLGWPEGPNTGNRAFAFPQNFSRDVRLSNPPQNSGFQNQLQSQFMSANQFQSPRRQPEPPKAPKND